MRYDIDDAKLAVLYEPNCIYNCEGDMTLVLAKKYSGGIIMASDGRMILAPKGKIADVDDKFEKIFPLTPYSVIGISGKDLDPEAVKHFGNSIKETVMKMLKAPYSIQDCASDVHCILKKTKETLASNRMFLSLVMDVMPKDVHLRVDL
jgi:20S proteasome alpha/beta subunit